METKKTAEGTFGKQESGGKNQERETYGGFPSEPNAQTWPSYEAGPMRGAGQSGKKAGQGKKSSY